MFHIFHRSNHSNKLDVNQIIIKGFFKKRTVHSNYRVYHTVFAIKIQQMAAEKRNWGMKLSLKTREAHRAHKQVISTHSVT